VRRWSDFETVAWENFDDGFGVALFYFEGEEDAAADCHFDCCVAVSHFELCMYVGCVGWLVGWLDVFLFSWMNQIINCLIDDLSLAKTSLLDWTVRD